VTASFRQGLDDPQSGWTADFSDNEDLVLVAFGGRGNQIGMPPFEFLNLLSEVPVGKIFVRDIQQLFYQGGVVGLGQTIEEVATALESLLAGRQKVAFIGNSGGGYAALLFGALLGIEQVMAISPQTFYCRSLRRLHKDQRWNDTVKDIYRLPRSQRRYLDLKPLLRRRTVSRHYQVYYGSGHPLDVRHATRLQALPGVVLCPQEGRKHNVAKPMRDDGTLKRILLELLDVR
jgi:pimeloyl-ACP methyl ester carboxylesterase